MKNNLIVTLRTHSIKCIISTRRLPSTYISWLQTSFLDFTWDIMQTWHFDLIFPDFFLTFDKIPNFLTFSWLLKKFFSWIFPDPWEPCTVSYMWCVITTTMSHSYRQTSRSSIHRKLHLISAITQSYEKQMEWAWDASYTIVFKTYFLFFNLAKRLPIYLNFTIQEIYYISLPKYSYVSPNVITHRLVSYIESGIS